MRKIILITIVFLVSSNFICSQHKHGGLRQQNINYFTKVAPPSVYKDRVALNKISTANFTTTFVNSPNTEAQNALQEAINIWSYILINTGREIKVRAEWKIIESEGDKLILANAAPQSYLSTTEYPDRYFPIALAEYIENENLNGSNFDILININTDSKILWYYGLDGNTPADKTDFLSTILHEIAHGLGFADSYSYNNTTKIGSTQYNYFDEMIVNGSGPTAFSLLSLANNSTALGSELISNDLYIIGQRISSVTNGVNPKICAPTTWSDGSSIAHLDEESYKANDNNSLMTPELGKAESIHSPGEITLSVLEDMGWDVASLITINEPNSSSYWVKGNTYQIKWTGNHLISINIDVYKKNSNGDYVYYNQIEGGYPSNPGKNAPYTWTIPSSYPIGEYRIKMLNGIDGYGLSEVFHITETVTGGPQNRVFLMQYDNQDWIGNIEIYPQNSNFWDEKSYSVAIDLPVASGFSVRSKPGFVIGTTKRFSHMYESYPNISIDVKYINHSDYTVRVNEMAQEKYQNIYLYVKEASDAIVLSNIEEINNIGSVGFKDPWFYDETTDPKGIRNRGLNAIYHSSSNFDLSTSSAYQGVFLEQGFNGTTWNPPYYSVKTTSPQLISNVQGKNRNFYFQNWESSGATFQNINNLETPVVFNQAGATVKAVMKGVGLSSNNLAFDQNNQRKIVRTDNGNLHMVYESMGKIWYERSTDNGSTWTIMNNNQPISSGNAKMPTIDFGFDNGVAIAYQQESDSYYTIQLKFFKLGVLLASKEVITGYYPYYYSSDAYPVVTYGYTPTNKLLVVWQMKSSNPSFGSSDLHYWIGEFNSSTNTIIENGSGAIANTDINSTKPSVVINRAAGYKEDYHLVWQQNGTSGSSVKYTKMVWDYQNENMIFSYYSEPSSTSGYASNFNPSIAITLNRPRVVWLTENPYTYILEGNLRTGNLNTWGTLTRFSYGSGYSVESINVNARNVDYGFVVGYGGDGQAVRYYKPSANYVAQPTRYDNYVQLSNGVNYTDMAIQTFNTASAPYYFNSTTVDATLSKTSGENEAIKGREIVFNNGQSNLIFEVNNIKVDENAIDFVEIEDTTVTKSNEEAISLFETESFFLTDKSNFSFDVNYILMEKENLEEQFGFEYQLVDINTNMAIGVLEKIETSKLDSEEENSVSYTINTEGIGNKQVKLKLVVAKDVADNVAIISTFSTKSDLAKASNKVISFDETLSITDYALEQNYPNPFNPSTVIKYQIPNDGLVSLKIYDITGQEVKTLVNQEQSKGRYEINFDASNLSTGVYFYRLTSGSYTKSMKMMLLK